jgi:carbon storage regulator CsrA
MFVVSRRRGEKIVLPNCSVTIVVADIAGRRVRLGVSAPAEVVIQREEIWRRLQQKAGSHAPASSDGT